MFTFLAELFAFGGIAFWILAVIVFGIIAALVENENGTWATITFIASLAGLNFLYKLPIIATIKLNPGKTAVLVLSYFAAGVVWSIVKWALYLHNKLAAYNDYKAKFLADNKAEVLTGELAVKLQEKLDSLYNNSISAKAPEAREHKGDLTRWATYWPFSIAGTLLNDVVRKAWDHIYNLLQGTYQAISKAIFKNATADIKMAEEYKAKKAAAGAGDTGTSDTASRRPQARDRF
jgi:hypothetical protein